MNFDRAMRIIRDMFFVIIAAIFILSASAFYISYLYKAAFVPVAETTTTSTTGILLSSESSIEIIGVILAIVFAFQGAILILIYKILQRDVATLAEQKIKLLAEFERKASRAEVRYIKSDIYGQLYDADPELFKNFRAYAWRMEKKAFQDIKGLNRYEYADIIFKVKNNFLCGLSEQQEQRTAEGIGVDVVAKRRAMGIKSGLMEQISAGEVAEHDQVADQQEIYDTIETCAYATYCFAESDSEIKKACQLLQSLKGKDPLYEDTKLKYPKCENL